MIAPPLQEKTRGNGIFPQFPLPILSIHRSQLEVVVLAAGVVGVLGGLVVDVPGDLVVDRRSRGLVLLGGLADGLLGVLVEVDDLLQVVDLVPAAAPLFSTQHTPSTLRPLRPGMMTQW